MVTRRKDVCIKVYLNQAEFKEMAEHAEKTGKRRRGLILHTQKKNGFAGQTVANTDGLSKFFKHCVSYWKEHESERMAKAADILRQEKQLQEEKKKLGLVQ
jgi:hypothetical protein